MPAYFLQNITAFLTCNAAEIMGALQQGYAADGFAVTAH
jgi:hypothetical protein